MGESSLKADHVERPNENYKTVVLFGGDNGGGDCCNIYYNDTWAWNGLT